MIYPPAIAILDDDDAVGKALQRILRSVGVEILAFTSVHKFLETFAERDPEVLILDVQMPEMTGLELQELLHTQKRQFPIIFITAREDEEFRQRALANGACGFLSKPFEKRTVLDLVDQARQRPRPSANLRLQSPLTRIKALFGGHPRSDSLIDFDSNDLQPCPFCGSHARLDKGTQVSPRGQTYHHARVVCTRCGAMVGTDRSETFPSSASAAQEAAKRWNRRFH